MKTVIKNKLTVKQAMLKTAQELKGNMFAEESANKYEIEIALLKELLKEIE